jgi:ParB-like chromosome segregation protein Spo0J
MASAKDFAHHRTNTFWVDPTELKIKPGLNARDLTTFDNASHIRDLADAIRADGYRKEFPLKVAKIDEEFVIVAGHCRHAALMLLRNEGHVVEFVPYIMEDPGVSDDERIASQRAENSGGKPLTPLEEGYNVRRLMGKGLTIDQIAERTRRSGTYIEQLLALQAAPVEVREMVRNKQVAAKTAIDTLRTEGDEGGTEVLREAVADAKAAGKKKAAPKDIQKKIEAKDAERKFRTAWRPKSGLLSVRIGNTEYAFPPSTWLEYGERIVKDARSFMEPPEASTETPTMAGAEA